MIEDEDDFDAAVQKTFDTGQAPVELIRHTIEYQRHIGLGGEVVGDYAHSFKTDAEWRAWMLKKSYENEAELAAMIRPVT